MDNINESKVIQKEISIFKDKGGIPFLEILSSNPIKIQLSYSDDDLYVQGESIDERKLFNDLLSTEDTLEDFVSAMKSLYAIIEFDDFTSNGPLNFLVSIETSDPSLDERLDEGVQKRFKMYYRLDTMGEEEELPKALPEVIEHMSAFMMLLKHTEEDAY